MELSELISDIKKEDKMTNDEIVKYLIASIEEEADPSCIYQELYKNAFGEHLTESVCRDWVKHLDVTDGSDRETGEKWSINQTSELGQRMGMSWDKMTKCEFYAVMNAFYSDFYKTGKMFEIETEPEFYASLVMDYFCNDADSHDKTPFRYYFTFVA